MIKKMDRTTEKIIKHASREEGSLIPWKINSEKLLRFVVGGFGVSFFLFVLFLLFRERKGPYLKKTYLIIREFIACFLDIEFFLDSAVRRSKQKRTEAKLIMVAPRILLTSFGVFCDAFFPL
jgi:hydrogenase-4 membrane subunit HyfE